MGDGVVEAGYGTGAGPTMGPPALVPASRKTVWVGQETALRGPMVANGGMRWYQGGGTGWRRCQMMASTQSYSGRILALIVIYVCVVVGRGVLVLAIVAWMLPPGWERQWVALASLLVRKMEMSCLLVMAAAVFFFFSFFFGGGGWNLVFCCQEQRSGGLKTDGNWLFVGEDGGHKVDIC